MKSPKEKSSTFSAGLQSPGAASVSDDSLIDRALDGDQLAYTLLFRRHDRLLRSAVGRYLRQPEEVDECLQDTFIRVYRCLPAFRRECRLSSWMYRVAVSTAINHYRKMSRRRSFYQLDETQEALCRPAFPEAVINLEKADRARWIHYAMGRLSAEDAAILRQFYLQEQSVEEICQVTGLSESNIKSRLMRARRRLRKVMEGPFRAERLN